MATKLVVVLLIIVSILFAGCLSGKENIPVAGSIFDVKPSDVTVKSGENAQVMVRVTNNGKSVIHPFVRFNLNSSDKQYVKFSNESGSYDMGVLRPGEDSGFRIVDFKAELAAGKEVKYQTRAQVMYDGKVLESRDIVITVRG
jgi:hypothetical protein